MAAVVPTSGRALDFVCRHFSGGISKTDEQLAVQALARHAMETADSPKNVREEGRRM